MENYHHGNLKNELIERGLSEIREVGLDKLSLRKLAKLCNVREAAPYSHFKNKSEYIFEMQKYVAEKFLEALKKGYVMTKKKDSPRCIFNMGVAYVLFAIEQPDYFNFIFTQPNGKIDLSMKSDNNFLPFQFFRDKCYEVYRALCMSETEIKFGIISMWAKVHGIATIASMKNVYTDFEWKSVLEKIILEK